MMPRSYRMERGGQGENGNNEMRGGKQIISNMVRDMRELTWKERKMGRKISLSKRGVRQAYSIQ